MAVESGTNTETVKGNSSLTIQAGSRTVDVTGGDYSATSSQAVLLQGKGAGVGIIGHVEGVSMLGNGQGVSITGNDAGVNVVGNGNGVRLFGRSTFYAEGSAEATIQSPVVNIGDQEVRIFGTKIVLQAGGGSITIDATGVTVAGTIVKIN